jgi:hypothetical protein
MHEALIERLEKNLEKINRLSNEASYLSLSRKFIEDLINVILHNNNEIHIPRSTIFQYNKIFQYNDKSSKTICYSVKSQKFSNRENLIDFFTNNITNSFIGIYQIYAYRVISFESFEPQEGIMMRYATDWFDKEKDKRFSDIYKQSMPTIIAYKEKEQKVDFITVEEMTI